MDHSQAQGLFSSLLEGDLDQQDEKALRDHLEACPLCREEYRAFERTLGALNKYLPQREAPGHLLDNIQKEIKKRSRGRFYGRQRAIMEGFKVQVEVFALLVIAMAGAIYLVLTPGPGSGLRIDLPGEGHAIRLDLEGPGVRGIEETLRLGGATLSRETIGQSVVLLARLPRDRAAETLVALSRLLAIAPPDLPPGGSIVPVEIWIRP